jgi:succinoglycan biosynthesis transport protein ExoP
VNLRDYLLIIRRRKWLGIIVLAATLSTAAGLTSLATPEYESFSSIFIGPQGAGFDQATNSLSLAERLTKTYARMLGSLPVAEKAVRDSDLAVPPQYLRSHLLVTPVEDTTLIELRVRDPDPVQAANMANATAEAFVDLAEDLTTPPGSNTPTVPVAVFEKALIPTDPVSPNTSRNVALAAVLGIVVGLGLMLAAEYLEVSVRGAEDVERLVHIPVIALIPRVSKDDLQLRTGAPDRPPRVRASR